MAELAARGHDADLCATRGRAGQSATRLGIEGSPIDLAVGAHRDRGLAERSPRGAGLSVLRTFAAALAAIEAPDLARAIERHTPDVLVIDVNCWGAATVAEASGLPWAMYTPYLLPLPSRDAPPFGMGLRPRQGPLGALRDAIVRRIVSVSFDRVAMPTIDALRARARPGRDRSFQRSARPPAAAAGAHRRGLRVSRVVTGRRTYASSVPSTGRRHSRRPRGSSRDCPTHWCSSPARPSASATSACSTSRWKRCPRPACP